MPGFVFADTIFINESMVWKNTEKISDDVVLCDICELVIQNSGVISGRIIGGAGVTQIIESAADITRLDVDGDYSIKVQGRNSVNIHDIMRVARDATSVLLENTSISLVSGLRGAPRTHGGPTVMLRGTITIDLTGLNIHDGMLLLPNAVGNAIIIVKGYKGTPLHYVKSVWGKEGVRLSMSRETDYVKIIGGKKGSFLNKLRMASPHSKTIAALDSADTMGEFYNIARQSASLNPIMLLRPISVMNRMDMVGFGLSDSGANVSYVVSKDFDAKIISVGGKFESKSLELSLGAYAGEFESSDAINEFSGYMYGLKLGAKINIESMWMRSSAAYTISHFDDSVVFNGTDAIHNPIGKSFYFSMDAGNDFYLDDEFYVSAFTGIGIGHDRIVHQSNHEIFGRVGAAAGYKYEMVGIGYDYQLFASVYSDNVYAAGVSMRFMSVVDGAGGGLSYVVMRDEFATSHKFSAEFKLKF